MSKKSLGFGLLLTLILLTNPASATDLRGMIQGIHQYTFRPFPARGVTVELYQQTTRGWQLVYRTLTGPDGMYYMRNIRPGRYWLQINRRQNHQLVVGSGPWQDIGPIQLSY